MVPFCLQWNSPINLWLAVAILYTGSCLSADQYETLKMGNLTYQQAITPVAVNENDSRTYLNLRLKNQLDVLLISDPQVKQATAAMNVGAGFKNEPNFVPGLAHFLEHLLFMGSEKYPTENDYFKYVKSRSGETNAHTEYDNTYYYFSINKDTLEGGLDRFSQFFIAPLFKQSSVEREARSVDSEYKNAQKDFIISLDQVKKNVSNPEYPYSYFGMGNYETLISIPKSKGVITRDVLVDFYRRNYLAKQMKLVVIGKESINELKRMVVPIFSKAPNYNPEPPSITGTPFTKKYLGIQINIVSHGGLRLEMEFLLPSQKMYYKEKPTSYISYFLAYKGTGSLSAHLIELGWIQSCGAKLSEDYSEFSLFNFDVNLTPLGLNHTDEIMEKVFSYINLLKVEGITKKRFNEIRAIKNMEIKYREDDSSSYYAYRLASAMQSPAPLSQVIMNRDVITSFNATLINDTLNYFNPRNMRVVLLSPLAAQKGDLKKEPYYGLEFSYEKIPESRIQELSVMKYDKSFHLPEPNPFVPSDFSLVNFTSHSMFPNLIYNNTGNVLWHTFGNTKFPKVSLNLIIRNNQWFNPPENNLKLNFLLNVVAQNLDSDKYLASSAGLSYMIRPQYPGISIELNGFSDKASELMMTVIKQINQPNITTQMLKDFNDRLASSRSQQKRTMTLTPVVVAQSQFQPALVEKISTNTVPNISKLTLDDLDKFINQDMSYGNLEMLAFGNVDQPQSKSLFDQFQSELNLKPVQREFEIPRRTVELPEGHQYVHQIINSDKNEINSAITVYFDLYSYDNPKQRVLTKLVCQLIAEPLFDQLRTKEQLGYIVRAMEMEFGARGGIFILLQSERDPIYLESRVNLFLDQFANKIKDISDEEFLVQKNSLKSFYSGNGKNLNSGADSYWSSIKSGYYDFHGDEILMDQLSKLTKSDVIETIQTLASTSLKRRKLSVHVVSNQFKREANMSLSDHGEIIQDMAAWKEKQELSPIPVPME